MRIPLLVLATVLTFSFGALTAYTLVANRNGRYVPKKQFDDCALEASVYRVRSADTVQKLTACAHYLDECTDFLEACAGELRNE